VNAEMTAFSRSYAVSGSANFGSASGDGNGKVDAVLTNLLGVYWPQFI
jgi:hypothetical protein